MAMAANSAKSTDTSSDSCPVANLPAELREMIYNYYFDLMTASKPQQSRTEHRFYGGTMQKFKVPTQTGEFRTLKPYFSMLHLSPVVRSETAATIYRTAFANRWFNLEIDSNRNDIERTKAMLSTFSITNADVEFGLHFEVRDCGRDVFLQFAESVLDVFASDGELWPELDDRWGYPERGRVVKTPNPDGKVGYLHESDYKDCHQLWVYGALAKFDWSGFEFNLPSSVKAGACESSYLNVSYYQHQLAGIDGGDMVGEATEADDEDDEDTGLDSESGLAVLDINDEDDEGVLFTEDEDEEGEEGLLDTEDD